MLQVTGMDIILDGRPQHGTHRQSWLVPSCSVLSRASTAPPSSRRATRRASSSTHFIIALCLPIRSVTSYMGWEKRA